MFSRVCLLLLLVAAPLVRAQDADKAKKDLADMQGVWKLVGFEIDGNMAILQEHKQLRWVIKDDKVFYGGAELAKFKIIDPSGNPKCLDLSMTNKAKRLHEGIYTVDKDQLKICVSVNADGVKDRPLKFGDKDIDKYRTLVFERDKPGNELEGSQGFVGIQLRFDDKAKEVQVIDTIKGSPADKAGFMKNDIVLKVSGNVAGDLQETIDMVRQLKPGSETVLRVRRDGKEKDITVKVGVTPFYILES